MRHVVIDNFGAVGSYRVPAGVVAVSLSTDSEYDCCLVDGAMLSVGGLLPVSAGSAIASAYGWATGAFNIKLLDANSAAVTNKPNILESVGGPATPLPARLSLLLWECGDKDVIAPASRAARRFETEFSEASTPGATEAVCALRIPYYGRTSGRIAIRKGDGQPYALPVAAYLRAVTYYARERCQGFQPGGRVQVDCYAQDFALGGVAPGADSIIVTSHVVTNISTPARVLTWGRGVNVAAIVPQDLGQQILGDELQVWLSTDDDDNSGSSSILNYYVMCEVFGERC